MPPNCNIALTIFSEMSAPVALTASSLDDPDSVYRERTPDSRNIVFKLPIAFSNEWKLNGNIVQSANV